MKNEGIRRINTNLPPMLANHVAHVVQELGIYETPSEFIRELIRKHMERSLLNENVEIDKLIRESREDNKYSELEDDYFTGLRKKHEI